MTEPVDPLVADRFNRQVRRLALAHRRRAAELLAPIGLHPGQEVFLLELQERGEATQAELAEALRVEPPTVTNMAQRLEAAGLISRRVDPCSRRSVLVTLSPAGGQRMADLHRVWYQLAGETLGGLRSTDADGLLAILSELLTGLEQD